MAFLDNSGDIILDAVLTDIGRKRMARGDFRISKFTIGDDEIDYGLFNKNHPSGSAYYDLEILQTPILECRTMKADINYGLLDITNQGMLYMPAIKTNPSPAGTTVPTSYSIPETQAEIVTAQSMSSGVYWLAANEETYTRLVSATALGADPKKDLLEQPWRKWRGATNNGHAPRVCARLRRAVVTASCHRAERCARWLCCALRGG